MHYANACEGVSDDTAHKGEDSIKHVVSSKHIDWKLKEMNALVMKAARSPSRKMIIIRPTLVLG